MGREDEGGREGGGRLGRLRDLLLGYEDMFACVFERYAGEREYIIGEGSSGILIALNEEKRRGEVGVHEKEKKRWATVGVSVAAEPNI